MKTLMSILIVLGLPVFAVAGSLVTATSVEPPNPMPFEPFTIYVDGYLPNGCWSVGSVGTTAFQLVDVASPEISCIQIVVPFTVQFDLAGRPEGVHFITITESHTSLYDPGLWTHVVEFVVGDPQIGAESRTWSAVKALYR